MKKRQLVNLGIPSGSALIEAKNAATRFRRMNWNRKAIMEIFRQLVANPEAFRKHPILAPLAQILGQTEIVAEKSVPMTPVPYRKWGSDLDPQSINQMENACSLPISVRGALMPDAHVGYGLPIGGVLATRGAVIPYAVGVDIACRMKMTVWDLPIKMLQTRRQQLISAIEKETRFGIGATFKIPRNHDVMDRDWSLSPVTRANKNKAWKQLGTSGSGNHFVEFGVFTTTGQIQNLPAGSYLALLSHSGSRGIGNMVASHYSKLAQNIHPELPKHLRHLSWLNLSTHAGKEYWAAMTLMGQYAEANHALIHHHLVKNLGAQVLLDVENHHNYAWKERHYGQDVIIHRKGATPANEDVMGIIPGSMATTAYLVRGRGNPESLHSASHGAGRRMSRKQAKRRFSWNDIKRIIDKKGVHLISAGLDEIPSAYKDIESVMAAQKDLVEIIGEFNPRLVKMAPGGEPPED